MAGRALLVLNRSAGTGHAAGDAERLVEALAAGHGGLLDVQVAMVDGHPAARSAAAAFCRRHPRESLVVAAGGGGTLRAAVEGVIDAAPRAVDGKGPRLGALRMGSGNVIARELGVPLDPIEGARRLGEGFARGWSAPCAVIRCTHGTPAGTAAVRHAVTMCGLGAWGLVPGDIARWRERHAQRRRQAAEWIGLERVNAAEYVAFGASRILAATVSAARCEMVELDGNRFRLLAAVALNLPLPPLPDPGVALGDAAAGLTVVPRFGRPFRRRIEPGREAMLRLLDRESVEFFLDEDPETAHDWLKLEIAGRLPFVSGRGGR